MVQKGERLPAARPAGEGWNGGMTVQGETKAGKRPEIRPYLYSISAKGKSPSRSPNPKVQVQCRMSRTILAGATGLEPAASLRDRRSNQLNYAPA
jgi:hypothetical protein